MAQSRIAVCLLLAVGFFACLFVIWTITFRLRFYLVSTSYKFIYAGKICFALVCGLGVYRIIKTTSLALAPDTPGRIIMRLVWFSILAIGCIFSAIGYYLYSRDVNAVLDGDRNITLPANPKDVTPKEGDQGA